VESSDLAPSARWPARLAELCRELRAGGGQREAARTEAWVLIRDALARYLRAHVRRVSGTQPEDVEDLASAKALEVLTRAESGDWDPEGRHPGEIAAYLATVARRGLTRLAERERRWRGPRGTAQDSEATAIDGLTSGHPSPEASVEASDFVSALRRCIERLRPRARRVWFFRAFLEMNSRDIAAHPEVGLSPAHVDVIVQRARAALRACLEQGGLRPHDMPAGAFGVLWPSLSTLAEPPDTMRSGEGDHAS
jgi:RNA polymerase sigma factor (sigma-70 family)